MLVDPGLCCFQFSVAQVLVGLQKQFINNVIFTTLPCAGGLNNHNKLERYCMVDAFEKNCDQNSTQPELIFHLIKIQYIELEHLKRYVDL